jgi:predicted nuclease of predicted toxin-antitoxin system
MKFLIDAQLPPGLAQHLCAAGFDAIHMTNILPPDADDNRVLAMANELNAILITKDEDFSHFASRGMVKAGILWIRFGNVTNQILWSRLEPLLPKILDEFARGGLVVEVT